VRGGRRAVRVPDPCRRVHVSVQPDRRSGGDGTRGLLRRRTPRRPPARRRARAGRPAPPGRPRVGAGAAGRRVAEGAAEHVTATLPALLDDLAARFGSREALVSSCCRMTYAELAAESVAVARGLVARGVGKGSRVGLLLPNSPEWITVAFAVWRCGACVVPLSTLDRARELGHCLRHADVTLLVGLRRFLRHDYV